MATTEKSQYNDFAPKYDSVADLPCSHCEAQLIQLALGDCAGLKVLDIGGGSGLHARRAVDAGAEVVDVVDISAEMMQIGQGIEQNLSREGRIRWHEADVSRPLAQQSIGSQVVQPGGYDVVMANWVFDHAHSVEDLEGMWKNIVTYLKPSGKFLGVRCKSIYAEHMKPEEAKYGAWFKDIERIRGGLRYQVGFLTNPPLEFECTSMEDSYTLTDEIPRQFGLVDFKVISAGAIEVVKTNPEFWKAFLDDPSYALVTARKPA